MHRLLSSLLLWPTAVLACNSSYQYFDESSCRIGSMTTERIGDGAKYTALDATERDMTIFTDTTSAAMGVCKEEPTFACGKAPSRLICRGEPSGRFALAGATFERVTLLESKRAFKCVAGCRAGTPKLIYHQSISEDPNQSNDHLRALAAFRKKCP